MRSIRTLILAGALAIPATAGLAQMYPGQDVTVNPYAIGPVPYHYGARTIHLHMPVHRRHVVHRHAVVAAVAPAPAKSADAAPTPAATPMIGTMANVTAPPAKPVKAQTAAAAKPTPVRSAPASAAPTSPAPTSNVYAGTGMDDAIPFSLDGVHSITPAKSAPAKTTTPAQAAPSVAPQPAAAQPGMTKRGEILFTKNATDPAPAQFDGLKLLAGDLSEALKNGSSRIQLEAYGGKPGDKGSDARRLSLKRALSIRQVLIDNGVPANTIDVRAMGGADDKGPADRVDVYVRAG